MFRFTVVDFLVRVHSTRVCVHFDISEDKVNQLLDCFDLIGSLVA